MAAVTVSRACLRARRSGVPAARKCVIFPPRKKSCGSPAGHRDRTSCHRCLTGIDRSSEHPHGASQFKPPFAPARPGRLCHRHGTHRAQTTGPCGTTARTSLRTLSFQPAGHPSEGGGRQGVGAGWPYGRWSSSRVRATSRHTRRRAGVPRQQRDRMSAHLGQRSHPHLPKRGLVIGTGVARAAELVLIGCRVGRIRAGPVHRNQPQPAPENPRRRLRAEWPCRAGIGSRSGGPAPRPCAGGRDQPTTRARRFRRLHVYAPSRWKSRLW